MSGRGRHLVPNLENRIACLEDLDRFHPGRSVFVGNKFRLNKPTQRGRNGRVFVQTWVFPSRSKSTSVKYGLSPKSPLQYFVVIAPRL